MSNAWCWICFPSLGILPCCLALQRLHVKRFVQDIWEVPVGVCPSFALNDSGPLGQRSQTPRSGFIGLKNYVSVMSWRVANGKLQVIATLSGIVFHLKEKAQPSTVALVNIIRKGIGMLLGCSHVHVW